MNDIDFNKVNLFGSKSLSDIFKDIYSNTKKKDKIIDDLISDLKPMVHTVSDAMQLIPYIKDYLEVGVKNNEHLIKMAAVVQRAIQSNKDNNKLNDDNDFKLSDEEKAELLSIAKEQSDSTKKITNEINSNSLFKTLPNIPLTRVKTPCPIIEEEPPIIIQQDAFE